MKTIIHLFLYLFLGLNAFAQDSQKAMDYFNREKYDSAVIEFEVALPLTEQKYGSSDTVYYSKQLTRAAESFEKIRNYVKAEQYYLQVKSIYEKKHARFKPEYTSILKSLASIYMIYLIHYNQADSLWNQVAEIDKEVYGENSEIFASDLDNMGLSYFRMGYYEKSELVYKHAIEIVKNQSGDYQFDYANVLHNLAQLYYSMGYYEKAEPLFTQAAEIVSSVSGENNLTYSVMLGSLAQLYRQTGRYAESEKLFRKALGITLNLNVKNKPDVAVQMNNLAVLYRETGEYQKAESLLLQALELDKIQLGENHPGYARDLGNLGNLYRLMGKQKNAEPYLIKALEIDKIQFGEYSPGYANHLLTLAGLYQDVKRDEEADTLMKKILETDKKTVWPNQPMYAKHLNTLAGLFNVTARNDLVDSIYRQVFQIYQTQIKTNTGFLSEPELEKFLNTFLFALDTYQSCNRKHIHNNKTGDFAYDIELTRKAILLKSALEIKNHIMESNDTALINTYYNLLALHRQINKLNNSSSSKPKEDIKKFENQANELEKSLAFKSKYYSHARLENEVTWKDVRQNLKPDEAAIEFSSFHYDSGEKQADSILYCAIILRKPDTIPQMVFLCEQRALSAACPMPGAPKAINIAYGFPGNDNAKSPTVKNIFKSTLYQLVWQPFDSLLKGIKTIYYSPSGLLNRISLAALPCKKNAVLVDKYNMVQLCSTRELVLQPKQEPITNAVVYGGVDYNADTASLRTKSEKYYKKENALLAYNHSSAGNSRNGFRYLPGTLEEAEMISTILKKHNITTTTYTGIDAVEESFVSLSGKTSPSVIHLSTHGFYFPDTISDENRKNLMFSSTGDIQFRYANDPLLRSGLLMAGANLAWKGIPRPEGLEDGILTAKEVSNLNLMNTQLVVLSACQTGLGDVKGNEGVEGLQRAFKMAGAKHIIVSLWEVPDKETTEFMSTFYDNWLGGKTIRNAFHSTQVAMKTKYNNQPFRWGGFVLVE